MRRSVLTRTLAILLGPAILAGGPGGVDVAAAASEGERLLEAGEYAAADAALREELRLHEAGGAAADVPSADRSGVTTAPAVEAWRARSAELRTQLMLCAFHREDLAAARTWQESVVRLRRALPDPERLADDLADLATLCESSGDDRAAADAWRESVQLLEPLGPAAHAERIVPRMSAWAERIRRLGEYEESESVQRAAIALSEEALPRDFRHARLLNNLGALYWDEHRYNEAARLLRDALRISEEDPETTPDRLAVALHNLANLAREQGDPESAEQLHRRAIALAREHLSGDPRFPYFLKEPAVLLAGLGRWEEAFPLWEEALAASAGQPLLQSEVLWERGRAQLEQRAWAAADSSFAECLRLRREARGDDHPMVGQAHLGLGLVQVQSGGASEDARAHLKRAAEILREVPVYPQDRAEAHVNLARLLWDEGDRPGAIAEMEVALSLVERLRWHRTSSEASLLEWTRRVADETQRMVGWLVAQGNLADALLVGERVRARILNDQLAAAQVDWHGAVPPDVRARLSTREKTARTQLATCRRRFEAALGGDPAALAPVEAELIAATRALEDIGDEYRLYRADSTAAVLPSSGPDLVARAARRLAPGERILSYHVSGDGVFLIELGAEPGDLRCHQLTVSAETAAAWAIPEGPVGEPTWNSLLAPRVGAVSPFDVVRGIGRMTGSASSDSGLARPPSPGRESVRALEDQERLGRILLPVAARERVLRSERVVLLPDGALHGWPMEALLLEMRDGEPRYWIDDGPMICLAPSLTSWLELGARSSACDRDGRIVSVSDPAFAPAETHGRHWSPLPGTQEEAAALARAFPTRALIQLAGSAAREAAVKEAAPHACVLHLGTHGIVEQDRSAQLAALVLAEEPPDSIDDGFLHLFEVYELTLDCDVVVLSACETKLGQRVRGEGVFALSRGFLAAGARRTVASLWAVDDRATAALMGSFFRRAAESERQTGRADWVQALRDAKRELRSQEPWASPFYWAPFVISGASP